MTREGQALLELCGAIRNDLGIAATAFRELANTSVIESTTLVFNAAGLISRDYPVPYAAVAIYSLSTQKVTAANLPPASGAPPQGQGTAQVGPLGFGSFNMAGRSLTLYGNPGDAVTFTVFAKPQAPNAASGQVALAGTSPVSGTVTSQVGPTSDLYTEAPQSRTTNGNTGNMTWPSTQTDAYVAVNITGFAGGTNVTISLDQQDANGIWQSLANSGTLSAVGTKNFTVGQFGGNHAVLRSGQPWRLSWTLTGVFTTLTFQVAVSAR